MRPARLFVRQDAKPGRLGALGHLPEHAQGVLVGLHRLVLGPRRADTRPDDRGDDEHREDTNDDSDHDPQLLE
jgi:hypothetical protein